MTKAIFTGPVKPRPHLRIEIAVSAAQQAINNRECWISPDRFEILSIIDTGSPQCYVNVGTLRDIDYGQPTKDIFAAIMGDPEYQCWGRVVRLGLNSNGNSFSVELPVYEIPMGPFMLIGQSLLDLGIFVYDGPKSIWTLTFDT
jgi:hypothetical protein